MSSNARPVGSVELAVPPMPEYLQFVRAIVGATAALDDRLQPGRVADVRLVVSEAATNAMRAQATIQVTTPILVRCDLTGDRIVVEVADHGPGFDPSSVPALPEVETPERLRHESGLGVSLMHQLTDQTIIESGRDGTAVRLMINLRDLAGGR